MLGAGRGKSSCAGFQGRVPDPQDRRNRIVTITPAGRRLAAACHAGIRHAEEDLLSTLDTKERAAFRAALRRLYDAAGG